MSKITARAAFRHPNFRRHFAARFASAMAAQIQTVAIGWQVYDLTHNPLDLGLVGLSQFLPAILLSLVTGHVADRFERRRTLLICYGGQMICALLLLALSARGLTSPWPIYGVLVLLGVVRAFIGPSMQALLPLLVPAAEFPNAVAWASSSFQVATICGPAAGGLLFAVGAPVAYGVCAGLGGLALTALWGIDRGLGTQAAQTGSRVDALLGGVRYVTARPVILGAISLDLFAVLLGGATALLPVYARDILHTGPWGLGMLRSAPAVGAFLTGVAIAHVPPRRAVGIRMFLCVALFGVATVVFGLSTSFPLSLAALMVLGASDMVSVFVRQNLVQLSTPDHMRGRVAAVNSVFIGASNELGEFESGLTAAWFGAVPAVVIGGLGTLAVVATWAWLFPALRRVDSLDQAALTEAVG